MDKKRVPIFIIGFFAIFILMAVIIGSIVFSSINKLQKADYYTLREDRVPSMKYVVGERRIYSVSKSSTWNTYRFHSDSAETDVYEYTKYLVEHHPI